MAQKTVRTQLKYVPAMAYIEVLAAIMKIPLSILFILIAICSYGQNWKNIGEKNIQFSNFTKPDKSNWSSVQYEYFKKGDKVIGVWRGLTDDFYALFQETPRAFDSIFKNAFLKTGTNIDTLLQRFDSSILKIKYKEAVRIEKREETYGYKEVIWRLKIYTWSAPNPQPCYVNVAFAKRKKPPKAGFLDYLFLVAFDAGCEI